MLHVALIFDSFDFDHLFYFGVVRRPESSRAPNLVQVDATVESIPQPNNGNNVSNIMSDSKIVGRPPHNKF